MKAAQFIRTAGKRRQAMALVMVITVVALMSILMVAIFSVTRTEYKSTQVYVAGKSAKQLADIGTAIVQAQIENGQNPDGKNSNVSSQMYTHATQPGMVRTYDSTGGFYAAYKLYSSSIMKVSGSESSLYSDQHVPPATWNTQPARYVDLNEPVVRAGLVNGTYAVYFPILDPRAAWNYNGGQGTGAVPGNTQVEGFSYTKTAPSVASGGGQDYSSTVVTPSDANSPDNLRLPMPVEWLYVLEDGTVGALDASNTFVSANPATQASAANPIVGRIAFWTDDESCKININTASEPTFMNSPFYFHERDVKWAHYPAVTGEYQRYPGHPATVALSAVLAPNYTLDPLMPSLDGFSTYNDIVNLKEQIYGLMPKISQGGSKEGTLPFAVDQLTNDQSFSGSQAATSIDVTQAATDRLFATVDEMLFKDLTFSSSTGRTQAAITMPSNGRTIFDHDTLERTRFFLTSQSRSPEFSIHGTPRVCIWPVADESKGAQWRTTFDNMTAFCSTLVKTSSSSTSRPYSYSFRRAYSKDYLAQQAGATPDVEIPRNLTLLNYLVNQMTQLSWPQTSYLAQGSGASSFISKYGSDNVNQLAVQFFDYIRCTNLYDGIEARSNNAYGAPTSGANGYSYAEQNYSSCYTFTNQRTTQSPSGLNVNGDAQGNTNAYQTATLPGHGQVTPALWNTGGTVYKGLGRSLTISEIGFQFICTADGNSHSGSLSKTFPAALPGGDGGGAAIAWSTDTSGTMMPKNILHKNTNVNMNVEMNTPPGPPYYFYSNFPPLIIDDLDANPNNPGGAGYWLKFYGCNGKKSGDPTHPHNHPGFWPQNWNMTLPVNTALLPGQKRIQVMLLLEFFCPSLGWTSFNPEWTIVLDNNIANMRITDAAGVQQALFDTTGIIPIKSDGNVYSSSSGAHPVGGHVGPTAVAGGRLSRSISGAGGAGGNVLTTDDYQNNTLAPGGGTHQGQYATGNTSGHAALQNYAFCSNFITVSGTTMNVSHPGVVNILIYDTHNYDSMNKPIQTLQVDLSMLPNTVPVPNLAGSVKYTETTDKYGRTTYRRSVQGPHYWSANNVGCVNRMFGATPNTAFDPTSTTGRAPNLKYKVGLFGGQAAQIHTYNNPASEDADAQALRGRLDTTAYMYGQASGPGISATPQTIGLVGAPAAAGIGTNANTADVIVTLVPAAGDYRMLAARYNVPSTWWKAHPFSQPNFLNANNYSAHSFTAYRANAEAGSWLATSAPTGQDLNNMSYQLVSDAQMYRNPNPNVSTYQTSTNPMQPDLPPDQQDFVVPANAFGDFDTGIAGAREGPYINKPDEGNYYVGQESTANNQLYRSAYFYNDWNDSDDWRSGIYMTPNRMIASPVMFGSLPTGVWGSNGQVSSVQNSNSWNPSGANGMAPWQTLLFRPHTYNATGNIGSMQNHPGMENPCDHYLLDMFFMPVVEPYAISEPLSISGRINMNYQIMPFINIRRATGMHALLKGEYMTAVPNEHIVYSKEYKPNGASTSTPAWQQTFFSDLTDNYYWHRPIDAPATLRQFDLKFTHKSGGPDKYQGLFRSASQICEMHLVPRTILNGGTNISTPQSQVLNANNQDSINQTMNLFWANNRATGDNVRERPYSNIYARLTTRSNTFRVHVRAQVLKKARSTAPTTVDPTKDIPISEYRGSTLLERYIDPTDLTLGIPDYAAGSLSQAPLDSFFRFHVLETKRFNP